MSGYSGLLRLWWWWPMFRDSVGRSEMPTLLLLKGLDATCHVCAHVGKPETTVQYTCSQEAEHPPWASVRLSVILSEEVRFLVKRHYHNGGHCAAKHRSQVKPSQFRLVGPLVAVKKLLCQSVAKPLTFAESVSQSNLWLNLLIQSIQLTLEPSHKRIWRAQTKQRRLCQGLISHVIYISDISLVLRRDPEGSAKITRHHSQWSLNVLG